MYLCSSRWGRDTHTTDADALVIRHLCIYVSVRLFLCICTFVYLFFDVYTFVCTNFLCVHVFFCVFGTLGIRTRLVADALVHI